MNYIVLDMEWNQPGYADTALCRNGVCMKNEIIQIGAVKLSENKEKTGVFECIIKPVSLTSMNRMIKQLTGITDEMIDKGEKDEKIIAVAVDDPYVNHYQEINDVPKVLVDEIEHFLKVYKNTTDKVEVFAPKGKADAKKVIQDAIDMYKRDVL